jgi:hypothetical protein
MGFFSSKRYHIYIYIFNQDTLNKYTWEEIQREYKVLQRYDLSSEDINLLYNKYKVPEIPYPPDENEKHENVSAIWEVKCLNIDIQLIVESLSLACRIVYNLLFQVGLALFYRKTSAEFCSIYYLSKTSLSSFEQENDDKKKP